MQGKKIKNIHKLSKVDKFIWNWVQLNKTFLVDINKYCQKFKDTLIIVQIEVENVSKIFIVEDQSLAKFCRSLKIFFKTMWNIDVFCSDGNRLFG